MKSVRFSLFALVLMWCSWHTLQAQDSIYLSLSARIENDTLILNVHPVRFTDIVSCRFGIRYPYADLDYVRATGNPLFARCCSFRKSTTDWIWLDKWSTCSYYNSRF
ncbi:MAG: hypothetical protein IPI30_02125 [Saprospiraceae bacterium]|nr:hypothetical protein [Candidatus Vicinibacter affinis]